jgi:hypothetical protein
MEETTDRAEQRGIWSQSSKGNVIQPDKAVFHPQPYLINDHCVNVLLKPLETQDLCSCDPDTSEAQTAGAALASFGSTPDPEFQQLDAILILDSIHKK